jgi:type IV pilus assembly protein PilA
MTSLNSKLQLALLNRKKGRNLLEKGFTLVELMIVIVIVGVLSSVALPNFLNQTQRAKATECTTKMAALLKQVHADYQIDQNIDEAVLSIVDGSIDTDTGAVTIAPSKAGTGVASPDAISRDSNGGLFLYTIANPATADTQLQIKCEAWTTATGTNSTLSTDYPKVTARTADDGLEAKGMFGCIDLTTGKIEVSRRLEKPNQTFNLSCGGTQTTNIKGIQV